MVNKFFNLFKKVGKEELITSNPPAKEATIEYRKKQFKKEIECSKTHLLKTVNVAIKQGRFECSYILTDSNYLLHTKKYHKTYSVPTILAARELRKSGFKVKMKTQMGRGNIYGVGEVNCYSKCLVISWK